MAELKNLSDKKKLLTNIIATISTFILNAAIGFLLSPYIVRTLGVEANGYVQLASNIVSYIAVITIALNSMSGRFITIAITKGETEKAVGYYTTVFWANIVTFIILLLPFSIVIWKLDSIININYDLLDVKMLFALAFANFAFSNLLSLWNNAYYATNTLFLQYARNMVATFIRVGIIVLLFVAFTPKVFFTTLASLAVLPLLVYFSLHDKNYLLPELKIDSKCFSFAKLKEILSSGIWRSMQSTGEILLYGLDLLVCNLLISPEAMGVLALSKTLPSMIQSLNWQIASTFAPKLTINFAQERKDIIWNDLKRSFKIVAIIGTIPLGGLIVYGTEFFHLWVPGEDAEMLQILSILASLMLALTAGAQPAGNIFATVNKVKPQAFSVIFSGLLNIIVVFLAIRFTNLGIFAVAGTSTLIGIVRNLCYTIPASAKYLGFKWSKFYIGIVYSGICTAIVVMIGLLVKYIIFPSSWLNLILSGFLTSVFSFLLCMIVILNSNERETAVTLVKTKFMKIRFQGEEEDGR
jgi:O-antigen/teichoic acid export membrane protein